MKSDFFTFKNFIVYHDKSSMKVSTDSALLACWCSVKDRRNILDVGCGCGVISLILANRNIDSTITLIDIDENSVIQSNENIKNTDINNRAKAFLCNYREFRPEKQFNLIISNPPFYTEETFSPDETRNNARHTSSLSFSDLSKKTSEIITDDGVFCVIIPSAEAGNFISSAALHGLYLNRRTDVHTTAKKPCKRTMMEFSKTPSQTAYSKLYIRNDKNDFSEEYKRLTGDFYL